MRCFFREPERDGPPMPPPGTSDERDLVVPEAVIAGSDASSAATSRQARNGCCSHGGRRPSAPRGPHRGSTWSALDAGGAVGVDDRQVQTELPAAAARASSRAWFELPDAAPRCRPGPDQHREGQIVFLLHGPGTRRASAADGDQRHTAAVQLGQQRVLVGPRRDVAQGTPGAAIETSTADIVAGQGVVQRRRRAVEIEQRRVGQDRTRRVSSLRRGCCCQLRQLNRQGAHRVVSGLGDLVAASALTWATIVACVMSAPASFGSMGPRRTPQHMSVTRPGRLLLPSWRRSGNPLACSRSRT